MIYLLTRPIAWLFKILMMVLRSPFTLVAAIRNHRMRKNVKVAARAVREQKKAPAS
jgi:hypothetical protein